MEVDTGGHNLFVLILLSGSTTHTVMIFKSQMFNWKVTCYMN